MAERDVHRVVRAEAGARRHEERVAVAALRERQHLAQRCSSRTANWRMARSCGCLYLRVPALRVHAVHAEHLQPAVAQVLAQRVHHPPVLPLEEAAHGGGEHQHARAGVAKHQQVHVAAQRGAVPAVMLAVHQGPVSGGRCGQDRGPERPPRRCRGHTQAPHRRPTYGRRGADARRRETNGPKRERGRVRRVPSRSSAELNRDQRQLAGSRRTITRPTPSSSYSMYAASPLRLMASGRPTPVKVPRYCPSGVTHVHGAGIAHVRARALHPAACRTARRAAPGAREWCPRTPSPPVARSISASLGAPRAAGRVRHRRRRPCDADAPAAARHRLAGARCRARSRSAVGGQPGTHGALQVAQRLPVQVHDAHGVAAR